MSVTLQTYLARKAELLAAQQSPVRPRCYACYKPQITCFCQLVKPVASTPRVLILMHPLEAKHAIGTGRLAHHCLANSTLLVGREFSQDQRVNNLIGDPNVAPMVLFPGGINLSFAEESERKNLLPLDREPLLIVLDGTWNTARKMLFHSPNLRRLPRICFNAPRPSRFRVRKQPDPRFFSTIEAIHEVLHLFGDRQDSLLEAFDAMIEHHLSLKKPGASRHVANYKARKAAAREARLSRQARLERSTTAL